MTGILKLGNGDVDTVQVYCLFKQGKNGINRLSTGGTFSENISEDIVCKITRDAFKKMSTVEKLVSFLK